VTLPMPLIRYHGRLTASRAAGLGVEDGVYLLDDRLVLHNLDGHGLVVER
jgi:hypothetical protein